MPDDLVTLRVGGRELGGWTAVRVRRSLQQVAGSFSVTHTERFPGKPSSRPIRQGEAVAVEIGGEAVITGFVDTVKPSYSAESHEITVQGRDATADLVDSAPDLEPAHWRDITVDRLAQILASPFGITVKAEGPVGAALPKVALGPGESAWSLIESVCRYRSLLPVSDGQGGLVLTQAGAQRVGTALVLGQNILAAEAEYSWRDRYSEYIVKGQRQALDEVDAESATSPVGRATDGEIDRHRPLVVVAERSVDAGQCQEHARWQATVRAGRGSAAKITVAEWRHSGGLWPVNATVPVFDAFLGLNRDMLIVDVEYVLDESGKRTVLSLVRPEAFTPLQGQTLEAEGALGFDE